MEDDERHAGPLRIVKRPSEAPIRPPDDNDSIHGRAPDPDHHARRASTATEESMVSAHEMPGATEQPLSIPKKRIAVSRLDGGAGRFYNTTAARSAGIARRKLNDTDRFGSSSDCGDTGLRGSDYEADGRYASVRSQYLRDAQHSLYNHEDGSHHQHESASHGGRHMYEDDAIDNFQRMRLDSDGIGPSIHDDPSRAPQYYDPRGEDLYGRESGHLPTSGRHVWRPGRPNEFGRHVSSFEDVPERHGHYDTLSALPTRQSPQRHVYGGRPLSTSDVVVTGPNLFPREPYVRAASAIPFDSPYRNMQPPRHNQIDMPQALSDRRLSQLLAKPDGVAEADPQILVPVVSVTPECRTVEGDVNSFWVAIELVAQITQPLDTGAARGHRFGQDYRHASTTSFPTDDDQGLYRFGYISGMDIKILPSYQSEILEVIGKSPSLITLLPGTRRLMVVHVHLDTTKTQKQTESQDYRPLSHSSKSDQLLEDLELQLGSTSREYMQIQLTYSHSGFPKRDVGRDPTDRDGGCVEVRTTIETTVTALVMQQNSSSLWSPPPAPAAGSPLVDIVAKHWGPAAAKEMAKRIGTSNDMRTLRRTGQNFGAWDGKTRHGEGRSQKEQKDRPSTPDNRTMEDSLDEVTPRAESQSQQPNKKVERRGDENQPEKIVQIVPVGQEQQSRIPPRKMKKDHRHASGSVEHLASASTNPQKRASLSQLPRLSMSSANIPADADPPSPGCLLPRSKNGRMASGGPRQAIPDTAPRNIRRPMGMDTTNLHNFAHGASEQSFMSENYDDRMTGYSSFRNSSRSSTISKRSGKWSWPGWFS